MPANIQELRKLPDGQHYYLIETKEPDGYNKLTSPIQVDVTVAGGDGSRPYRASENIDDLINIGTPTAAVVVTDTNAELLPDSDGRFVLKVINKYGSVEITIHKVNEKNRPLPDAVFKLTKGAEIVVISDSGTGVIVAPKVAHQASHLTSTCPDANCKEFWKN